MQFQSAVADGELEPGCSTNDITGGGCLVPHRSCNVCAVVANRGWKIEYMMQRRRTVVLHNLDRMFPVSVHEAKLFVLVSIGELARAIDQAPAGEFLRCLCARDLKETRR